MNRPPQEPGATTATKQRPAEVTRTILHYLGIDIRPGEGRLATLILVYSGLLFACFYTGKVIRQSIFVDELGSSRLPFAYLLVALVSYPVLRLYGKLVDHIPRRPLAALTNGFLAFGSLIFWWWFGKNDAWIPLAFYVWIGVAFGIAVSQFWSYANHIFDARRAKRLFALIAAGGALGGLLGSQLARLVALHSETRNTLLLAAILLLSLAFLIQLIDREADHPEADKHLARPSKRNQARGGLRVVFSDRYLRLVGLTTFISLIAAQVVDLQFNWVVEQNTSDLSERTSVFGHLFSLISIGAFVFQIFVTSRIHRYLGVGVGMRILPFTILGGTVALLLAGAAFPGALLAVVFCLKIGEGGFRHSIEQVTRELLFLPVQPKIRPKAKAYIDVFVTRFGRGAAALVLMTVTFQWITPIQAGWFSLVLALIWLAATLFTYRHYISCYRESLQTGTMATNADIDLNDITTMELLVQSLGSPDPHRVLNSIDLLVRHGRGRLIPPLLLYHDDAEVRLRTLEVLAEEQREDAVPLIHRCLGDSSPDVRATAVRTLSLLQGENACELMLPQIRNPDPRVRAAAIACLASHGNDDMSRMAGLSLAEMVQDAESGIRTEAAKCLCEIPDPLFQMMLVQMLYDKDQGVVRQAVKAVQARVQRGGNNPIYVPTVVSLMRERRLKHQCREALVACGEDVIPALVHFMNDPDEHSWVRRAIPKTIAQIGGIASATALVDNLKTGDSFLRHKVIEALGRLCGRQVNMNFAQSRIRDAIRNEATRYLQYLADLHVLGIEHMGHLEGALIRWTSKRTAPTLLHQLMAERLGSQLSNLLGLVGLLYPKQDIRAAERNLTSRKLSRRSNAQEYLDNALSGEVHRFVLAVIDDAPLAQKLKRAQRLLGVRGEGQIETLRRLMHEHDPKDPDRSSIAAAALYRVFTESIVSLYGEVEQIATSAIDPFVKETAEWVLERMRISDPPKLTPPLS
ncbi:ADP,ATP carrier protein [Sulfidibacter corallicola]|uniref:MFS transporter n=1 Tax=Sulfidibacter corallicola TaxID=2818388 RepID=A0A8A4TPC8_SULCO|nr:MFS transporter [Sulfidibacter corallicola]QTD51287.1 MFS transporter [Sulfidibacter corallicola]